MRLKAGKTYVIKIKLKITDKSGKDVISIAFTDSGNSTHTIDTPFDCSVTSFEIKEE